MPNRVLISNKLDRLYFSRRILFIDYVDAFNKPPPILEGAMMVPMFKWELSEDPTKLRDFFEHYGLFVRRALKLEGKNNVLRTTSQHLGGFSILADHDKTGNLTIKSMKEGPVLGNNPNRSLIGMYDLTNHYGPIMNIFSDFLEVKGEHLTNILMGESFYN